MHSSFLRNLLLTWVLLGAASGVANAGILIQHGRPQATLPLSTYGMNLEAQAALRQILPKGWQLITAPGTALCAHVSWKPGNNWLVPLAQISAHSSARFVIDWPKHELIIQSLSAPFAGSYKRQFVAKHIASPKRKPLVRHATHIKQKRHPLPVSRLSATTPALLYIVNKPLTSAQRAALKIQEEAAVQAGLRPIGPRNPARSFYTQSGEQVLKALADHYHARLEWHGPNFPLPGPVTFLFQGNISEDVGLLQRALGPYAPLAITYYVSSHELVVRHALYASFVAYEARPVPPRPRRTFWQRLFSVFRESPAVSTPARVTGAKAPGILSKAASSTSPPLLAARTPLAAPLGTTTHASPTRAVFSAMTRVAVKPSLIPSPTTIPSQNVHKNTPIRKACPELVLTIMPKARLSVALETFLNAHNWSLSWKVPYDMRADNAGHIVGRSIGAILDQLLPGMDLNYRMDFTLHSVTVTARDPAISAENAK